MTEAIKNQEAQYGELLSDQQKVLQERFDSVEADKKAQVEHLEKQVEESKAHNAKMQAEFAEQKAKKEEEFKELVAENEQVVSEFQNLQEKVADIKKSNEQFSMISVKHNEVLQKFKKLDADHEKEIASVEAKIKKIEHEESAKYDMDRF